MMFEDLEIQKHVYTAYSTVILEIGLTNTH